MRAERWLRSLPGRRWFAVSGLLAWSALTLHAMYEFNWWRVLLGISALIWLVLPLYAAFQVMAPKKRRGNP